jgi:hypothetical protein
MPMPLRPVRASVPDEVVPAPADVPATTSACGTDDEPPVVGLDGDVVVVVVTCGAGSYR